MDLADTEQIFTVIVAAATFVTFWALWTAFALQPPIEAQVHHPSQSWPMPGKKLVQGHPVPGDRLGATEQQVAGIPERVVKDRDHPFLKRR